MAGNLIIVLSICIVKILSMVLQADENRQILRMDAAENNIMVYHHTIGLIVACFGAGLL